jgi:hypothetical protein
MIVDKLRELIVDEIQTQVAKADLGLGGNSTNPTATSLDVALGLSTSQAALVESESDLNVIEFKITVSGSDIDGKVIREAGLLTSGNALLQRINFDGIGPIATTDTLEIFILVEVE